MKKDLEVNLEYSADEIKKMTPLQASLVLNNGIKPEEYEETLPKLEEEYETEQEALRQQDAEQAEQQRIEQEAQAQVDLTQQHQQQPQQEMLTEEIPYTFETKYWRAERL
ncbi:MAG: hypothetical protein SGARI_006166 [Bacillariaceae sp.]